MDAVALAAACTGVAKLSHWCYYPIGGSCSWNYKRSSERS